MRQHEYLLTLHEISVATRLNVDFESEMVEYLSMKRTIYMYSALALFFANVGCNAMSPSRSILPEPRQIAFRTTACLDIDEKKSASFNWRDNGDVTITDYLITNCGFEIDGGELEYPKAATLKLLVYVSEPNVAKCECAHRVEVTVRGLSKNEYKMAIEKRRSNWWQRIWLGSEAEPISEAAH